MRSISAAEEKAALRKSLRAALGAQTPEALRRSDDALFARFLALPQVAAADTLLLYCGMGPEPDTRRLFAPLWAAGKRLALPRWLPNHGMEARAITPQSSLVRHPYGMLEPGPDCPLLLKGSLNLILVPGLSFDRLCYRLGQGGGYYDRYLADYRGFTVALCRDGLFQTALPRGPFDLPVDLVLTETQQHKADPFGSAQMP
ncbi:MAG: 5-formyltetrahydrofolate cyclo-ligase [Pseudoflavonifractor sp.]